MPLSRARTATLITVILLAALLTPITSSSPSAIAADGYGLVLANDTGPSVEYNDGTAKVTASRPVGSGYQMRLYRSDGTLMCLTTSYTCTREVRLLAPGDSVSLEAQLINTAVSPSQIVAVATLTVTRKQWTGSVSLTASNRRPVNGGSVTLTATASEVVGWPYEYWFRDHEGNRVKGCYGTSCSVTVTVPDEALRYYDVIVSTNLDEPKRASDFVTISSMPDEEVVDSAEVSALADELLTAAGGPLGACLALGEAVRSHAARSSVPDVTLVCTSQGLKAALQFASKLVGLEHVLEVVDSLAHATNEDPQPELSYPDCDQVSADGTCLDEGTPPSSSPLPEPDPAGGGIRPPPNCMDGATAQQLTDSMPVQAHHVATRYGAWYETFQSIVSRYGLDVIDSTAEWNVFTMPHRGPHPAEYHTWVLQNMINIDIVADGDRDTFIQLFRTRVVDVVIEDPTITRVAYWECYR